MIATENSISQELLELERRYWEAIRKRDTHAVSALSDDPCVIVGAQGARKVDKESLAGLVAKLPVSVSDYSLDDVDFRQIAEGVMVVTYKVNETLVVEGEDVALEAFDSSVWVRRNGGWVCSLHTESVAGDPYGRK